MIHKFRNAGMAMVSSREAVSLAVEALQTSTHTIVAGDLSLGRRLVVDQISASLRAQNVPVIDTVSSDPMLTSSTARAVVVVDMTSITLEIERWCLALVARGTVTVLVAMGSSDPIHASITLLQRLRAAQALEITLAPLEPAEARALLSEKRTARMFALSGVEESWIIEMSSGSPVLLGAYTNDYIDAPPDSLNVFGRNTRVVANDAISELPIPLVRVAHYVAELPGISAQRLRQFVDGTTFDLLGEMPMIRRVRDTIVMTQSVALVLRLTADGGISEVATLAVTDIISSLALDTPCTEAEVILAATRLLEHPLAFAHIPWIDRSRLLFLAMWVHRRMGAADRAAFIARGLMTQPGWQGVTVLSSLARGQVEDLAALGHDIRANTLPQEAHDIARPWLQCLSLPVARDSPAAHVAMSITAPHRSHHDHLLEALSRALSAAGALDEGRLDDARNLAEGVVNDEGAHDATRLRAMIVIGAAAAMQCDGDGLDGVTAQILTVTFVHHEKSLETDLARRNLDDAILMTAVAYASFGASAPAEFLAEVDRRFTEAATHDDHPTLARMAIIRLVLERDDEQVDGITRFMNRLEPSDLNRWVLSQYGGEAAPQPAHLVAGTYMDHALASVRMLNALLRFGPETLRSMWNVYPTANTLFREIIESYLSATLRHEIPTNVSTISGLNLPAGSLLRAVRDHVVGLATTDPTAIHAALEAFVAAGAWDCARIANHDLSRMTEDDPSWTRTVTAARRALQTQMRAIAATQSALTPREQEIAVLASRGMRNSQIAEELFISIRTVESHLYRALRKLSSTREELSDRAASRPTRSGQGASSTQEQMPSPNHESMS